MVLVFLLLLHPHFHCCPNLSSYLRLRNHQTRHDADTRTSLISVIAKVLHQLHFHPHLQRPSFESSALSMPKWHQNGCKTKLGWAVASSHYTTAQPCGCSSSMIYRGLILQEFPTVPLLVQKERQVLCLWCCKGIITKLILMHCKRGQDVLPGISPRSQVRVHGILKVTLKGAAHI